MTDDMIPTPYGVLVDVATGETIGPATAEQHAARAIPGAPLLTLADGRQADVTGGPDLAACGHSAEDHEEAWQDAKRHVVSAITWLRDQGPSDEGVDLAPDHKAVTERAFPKVCLVSIVGTLAYHAGFHGGAVENDCRAKDAPLAGLALHHVMWVADTGGLVSPKLFDVIGIMDVGEMSAVLELGADAAGALGMSNEDVRAYVMDGKVPDHHG